jgi:hypothetical protein
VNRPYPASRHHGGLHNEVRDGVSRAASRSGPCGSRPGRRSPDGVEPSGERGIEPDGGGVRKTGMRVCGRQTLTSTSRAAVNATIIPRNHQELTIQEVS